MFFNAKVEPLEYLYEVIILVKFQYFKNITGPVLAPYTPY
jgi:hypothetical protein